MFYKKKKKSKHINKYLYQELMHPMMIVGNQLEIIFHIARIIVLSEN